MKAPMRGPSLLVLLLAVVAGSAALLLAALALSTGVPAAAFALAGAGDLQQALCERR